MASQVQIPFEGVILQEHSAPISCPTPNFAKGSLEAMKMQSTIYAPKAGRVSRILVEAGQHVEAKDLLLTIE